MKNWRRTILLVVSISTIFLSACKKSENPEKTNAIETTNDRVATIQNTIQKIPEQEQTKTLYNDSIRNVEISYAEAKAYAKTANARFAAAWRRIPQPLRNRLQHSISYMTEQVDLKCKNHSYSYPAGETRKAQYLYCSLSHENILSNGIENFANSYNRNPDTNFFDYVNPEAIINTQSW